MSDGKPPKTRLRIPGLALNEEDEPDSGAADSNPPEESREDPRYHVSKKTRLGINPEFVLADDALDLVEEDDGLEDEADDAVVAAAVEESVADAAGDVVVAARETAAAAEHEPGDSIQVKEIASVSYDMNVHDTVAMDGFDPEAALEAELESRPTISVARPGVAAPTMKVTAWDPLPEQPDFDVVPQRGRPSSRVLVIAVTVVSAVLFAVALYAYLT